MSLLTFLFLIILTKANPLKDTIKFLCIGTDCDKDPAMIKLKEMYSITDFADDKNLSSGLYSSWSNTLKKNDGSITNYTNLNAFPYGFQVTKELLDQLKHFNHPIKIAVLNGTSDSQQNFFLNFLELAKNEPYVGYIELTTQFNLAFSFEVYRRHCPTIIAYNPATEDLWLTYTKFTGSNTIDTPNIIKLLAALNKGEVRKIKLGWMNLYTKFLNLNYIYNNFHFMFNYFIGGISIMLILILLVFEKPILNLLRKFKSSTTEDPSKKNK